MVTGGGCGWLVVLVVLGARWCSVVCFSCVCSPSECEEVRDSECPLGAGTVWDSCGCCRVCARIEGEPCGGPYGFYGACAAGLQCVVTDLQSDNADGVCTRTPGGVACSGAAGARAVSGCNIVGAHCRCGEALVCAGDPAFSFRSLVECQMNLAVLLAHAHSVLQQGDSSTNWREHEALHFMRGMMDECTHLRNFSVPVDTSLIIAVCARNDGYVPREGVTNLADIWPGVEVRYVDAGHVTAFLLHQKMFRSAIIDSFERARSKYYASSQPRNSA